jgi:hypothetical protein
MIRTPTCTSNRFKHIHPFKSECPIREQASQARRGTTNSIAERLELTVFESQELPFGPIGANLNS